MSVSPLDGATGPISVTVSANGSALDDTVLIKSIQTRSEIGRIPEAIIEFFDGDIAASEFPLTDGTALKPGSTIAIDASYGDQSASTIFNGVVVSQRLRVGSDGAPSLSVRCRDKAIAMTTVRKWAQFSQQKDSDIISNLASEAGLSASVDSTKDTARDQVQTACSDWDFMMALCDRNGLVVTVSDGTITAKAPDLSATAPLGVTLGMDIINFDCELDGLNQLPSAELGVWNTSDLEASSEGGQEPSSTVKMGNISASELAEALSLNASSEFSAATLDQQSALAHASARLTRGELARVRGKIRYNGSNKAQPGDMLEVAGIGERLSGVGYITGINHNIVAGRWTTDAVLGLAPRWMGDSVSQAGSAGTAHSPPVHGLHSGIVAAITENETDATMIQVNIPTLGTETKVWARYAAPYASTGYGLMFIPEIGDEVIVGFYDANPSYPIILGSLHGPKADRPTPVEESNSTKQIKTKSELELTFDDENKVITVQTPGGISAVLSDEDSSLKLEDSNGNSLTLDSSGITIASDSDVTITAKSGFSAQADMDAEVSGQNVTVTGEMDLSASGNASAKLESGGTITVQGSLVNIN